VPFFAKNRQLHDVFAEQDDDEDGFYTTTGELFGSLFFSLDMFHDSVLD